MSTECQNYPDSTKETNNKDKKNNSRYSILELASENILNEISTSLIDIYKPWKEKVIFFNKKEDASLLKSLIDKRLVIKYQLINDEYTLWIWVKWFKDSLIRLNSNIQEKILPWNNSKCLEILKEKAQIDNNYNDKNKNNAWSVITIEEDE